MERKGDVQGDLRTLAAGELEATFAPAAGMVGCSLRHRGEELLGQRKGLRGYVESGSTMGIPLLHPWANRLGGTSYRAGPDSVELDPARSPLKLDPNGLPIHGLLTADPGWQVTDSGPTSVRARFDFGSRPELLAAFPFPHELSLGAELSESSLTVVTELRPTGVVPVPVAFGFHPYLTLPAVARKDWLVTLPVRSRALPDQRGIPTGQNEPAGRSAGHGFAPNDPFRLGEITFDDLFPQLEGPEPAFVLEGGGRRISVIFGEGYPVGQVYAPPGEPFICFEPMTAPTNALLSGDGLRRITPGATFRASFRIEIEAA